MSSKLISVVLLSALASPVAVHAQSFSAVINPLNGSNVFGTASLQLNDNMLTVDLFASGLEPNQLHIQHIHGLVDASGLPVNSTIPTLAQDTDHDRFIELAEGLPTYGPILLQLTNPPGNPTTGFPTAPNGEINYHQTFDLSQQAQFGSEFNKGQLLPLEFREIIIHGLTVGTQGAGTPGEVDGVAGFKVALPIAGGEIFATSVSPIPEPETYGMMLTGLGLMGFIARRKAKSKSADMA